MDTAVENPVLKVGRTQHYTDDFLDTLFAMKNREEMTDFTIKVNKIVIPCHSTVMATASPYFKTLLHSPMKEKSKREVELTLQDTCVQRVIDYCYTGKIEIELSLAEEYLETAEYFQLLVLKTAVEVFVCDNLKPKTCIGWFMRADIYCLDKLKARSLLMMVNSFPYVVEHIEFHQLTFTELIDYIKQVVDVQDGNDVLDASFSWVTYNVETRSEKFIDILRQIKLDKCSPACMEHIRRSWKPIWADYADVQTMLTPSIVTPEREEQLKVFILGGILNSCKPNRNCWKFDFESDTYTTLGKMAYFASKTKVSYCFCPKGLVAVGGYQSFPSCAATKSCSVFSLREMNWRTWSDASHPITEAAAVYTNGCIYFFASNPTYKSVHCLNINTKYWSTCPDMPESNVTPLVAAIDGKIYLVHNIKFDRSNTKQRIPVDCFDTATEKWSAVEPIVLPVRSTQDASAVVAGGELYIIGGMDRLCAYYKPKLNTWHQLKAPKLVHRGGTAVHMAGHILLFGGTDAYGQCHSFVEAFLVKKRQWTTQTQCMPFALQDHYAVVYDELTDKLLLS